MIRNYDMEIERIKREKRVAIILGVAMGVCIVLLMIGLITNLL